MCYNYRMGSRFGWRSAWGAGAVATLLPAAALALNVLSVTVYTGPSGTGPWSVLTPTPPSTNVTVGDYLRLAVTLENDDGQFGNMFARGFEPPQPGVSTGVTAVLGNWCTENDGASGWWPGAYWIWPVAAAGCTTQTCEPTLCTVGGSSLGLSNSLPPYDNPGTPVSFVDTGTIFVTSFAYNGFSYAGSGANETAFVSWVFRAEREWPLLEFFAFGWNADDAGVQDSTLMDPPDTGCFGGFLVSGGKCDGGGVCDCSGFSGFACTSDCISYSGSFVDCGAAGCPKVSPGDAGYPLGSPFGAPSVVALDTLLDTFWSGSTIKIVAPVTADSRLVPLLPPGSTRPPGMVYVGDVVQLETSVTNSGGSNPLSVTATGFPRVALTSGICYQVTGSAFVDGCGRSALDPDVPGPVQSIALGSNASFLWSFTVGGKAPACGGSCIVSAPTAGSASNFFAEVLAGGALSQSNTLYVMAAPLAMTVTLWLDEDGAGGAPIAPLGALGGTLYYMTADRLEARITYLNTGTDPFDVDTALTVGDDWVGGNNFTVTAGPPASVTLAPGVPQTLTYAIGVNPAGDLASRCLHRPDGPVTVAFSAAKRGVCLGGWNAVKVEGLPFDTYTTPGDTCPNLNLLFDLDATGGEVEQGLTTFAVMHARNPLARPFTIAAGTAATVYIGGTGVAWAAGPALAGVTWLPGETKDFSFTVTGVTPGLVTLSPGFTYGTPASPTCACLEACCGLVGTGGGNCNGTAGCVGGTRLIVAKPHLLALLEYAKGINMKVEPLDFSSDWCGPGGAKARVTALLENRSAATVTVESINHRSNFSQWNDPASPALCSYRVFPSPNVENPPVVVGPTVVSAANPLGFAPPFEMAPLESVTIYWDVCGNTDSQLCGTMYFGSIPGFTGCTSPFVAGHLTLTPTELVESGAAKSMDARAYRAPALACAIETAGTLFSVGESFTARFTVTNTGELDLLQYSFTLTAAPADVPNLLGRAVLTSVLGPPFPPPFQFSSAVLGGSGGCTTSVYGATASYRFDFIAAASGEVRLTAVANGIAPMSGTVHACSSVTVPIRIIDQARVTVTAWATPVATMTRTCAGCPLATPCAETGQNCVDVVARVRNAGSVKAVMVRPVISVPKPCGGGATGALALLSQSANLSGTVEIAPGAQQLYSWRYAPAGLGSELFSVSVASMDGRTNCTPFDNPPPGCTAYVTGDTNCLRVLPEPPVEMRLVSVTAARNRAMRGQEFEVVIEVRNPGDNPARLSGGEPALVFVAGATGAAVTEYFSVSLPTPVTVPAGSTVTLRARVTVHPRAPVGAMEIRIPSGRLYQAVNTVTGLPWEVKDAGVVIALEVIEASYALEGADANPFYPAADGVTRLKVRLAEAGAVQLKIYSITGELVRVLVDEARPIGYYEEPWDGRNSGGEACASGVYLVRLEGRSFATVKKLAVVR